MPNYSRNDIVLVRFPFSDLTGSKVRPAVIVSGRHLSKDLIIVPLTSKTTSLLTGEFVLSDWTQAGLNVPSAVKRGIFTSHQNLVMKVVGRLSVADAERVEDSLRGWLEL